MRAVATLAATAALCACALNGPSGPQAGLAGSWEWQSSSGGIGGFYYTPASQGYAVRLEFDDGVVRAFRNGSLVAQSSYTAELAEDAEGEYLTVRYEPQLPVFDFGVLEEHSVRFTDQTAVFAEPCCDRFAHEFRRAH